MLKSDPPREGDTMLVRDRPNSRSDSPHGFRGLAFYFAKCALEEVRLRPVWQRDRVEVLDHASVAGGKDPRHVTREFYSSDTLILVGEAIQVEPRDDVLPPDPRCHVLPALSVWTRKVCRATGCRRCHAGSSARASVS